MFKNPHDHGHPQSGNDKPNPPRKRVAAAIDALLAQGKEVECDYDHFGHARHLCDYSDDGLYNEKIRATVRAHARRFLNTPEMQRALALQGIELRDGEVVDFTALGLGHRVQFRQVMAVPGRKRAVGVLGGYIHVFVQPDGTVKVLNSTIRRGKALGDVGTTLNRSQAIAQAKKKHGLPVDTSKSERWVSQHKGSFDPVYRITLDTKPNGSTPRKVFRYMVNAKTGDVVYEENRLHYSGVPGKSFLRIPNPDSEIGAQIKDCVLTELPDPSVLKNQRFEFFVLKNRKWVQVKANKVTNPDNSVSYNYNFTKDDPEFSAVTAFYAMDVQYQILEKLGMPKQTKPIKVFMDDPKVRDNAYFDAYNYEIHMGLGSGIDRGGLTKNVGWDLGVEWHENGHHVVFLTCPAQDLPGSEGGAMHESCGDLMDLVMDFIFRAEHAAALGEKLTIQQVLEDRAVVGFYALPPDGIRIQKNTARTPQDKKGEVHADGLISGGAAYDTFLGMISKLQDSDQILDLCLNYLKLYLGNLAAMPGQRCLFKDQLRGFITADQAVNGGANKDTIVEAHGKHGITLGGRADDDGR